MATLDIIILVALACGIIGGFVKGVLQQAFSLGGLILGLVFGMLLYKPLAGFLQTAINMSDKTAQIVGFILILLLVPITFGLVGRLLSKLVRAASLGFVDRLLGAAFGFFKWLIVIGLIFQLMDMGGLTDKVVKPKERRESQLYQPVRGFTEFCLDWAWNKVLETGSDLAPELPQKAGGTSDRQKT